jgi:hypothetical protein
MGVNRTLENSSKRSKKTKSSLDKWMLEVFKIGQRAIDKAQEENRRMGLPNVFSRNGKIYYELPNGTITTKGPRKIAKKNSN